MSRRDQLRRVVILCCHFARNLAYYRVGQSAEYGHLLDPARTACANFWRMANSDFLDLCILEWCKLFADVKGRHHWRAIVTDASGFHAELLTHLRLDDASFKAYIDTIRRYRDKFVAHLDSDPSMYVPKLDVAKQAVWFYHAHVVTHESKTGDLSGLAVELNPGYRISEDEARTVFRMACKADGHPSKQRKLNA